MAALRIFDNQSHRCIKVKKNRWKMTTKHKVSSFFCGADGTILRLLKSVLHLLQKKVAGGFQLAGKTGRHICLISVAVGFPVRTPTLE